MILGLVLGPLFESNVRRSLVLSRGDPTVFFTRPISLGLIVLAIVLVIVLTTPALMRRAPKETEAVATQD
jgi:TctA family transporter